MKRDVEFGYWLIAALAYCVPNVLAFFGVQTGWFMDEAAGNLSLGITTQLTCIATVLGSFLLLVYCCHSGAGWFTPGQSVRPHTALGVFVFIFQLLGLFALFAYDFGRVGGERESQEMIPRLISYSSPDALFMIYYSHSRRSKIPYINTLTYIVSSALRGWSGFIVIIFFVELYLILQRTSLARTLAIMSGVLVLLFSIYPKVNAIKGAIRGSIIMAEETYAEAFDTLLARLQHVAIVEIAAQDSARIRLFLSNGAIVPFYADNRLGFRIFPRQFGAISLQQYLALKSVLSSSNEDYSVIDETEMWFTHTGIAGWLFVLPWYVLPFYLLFVCAILLFPYWICSRFIKDSAIVPALHCAGIIYVFHGWFGPQILFCIACFIYVCVYRVIILVNRDKSVDMLAGRRAGESAVFGSNSIRNEALRS